MAQSGYSPDPAAAADRRHARNVRKDALIVLKRVAPGRGAGSVRTPRRGFLHFAQHEMAGAGLDYCRYNRAP
jgi:hypothetical protein